MQETVFVIIALVAIIYVAVVVFGLLFGREEKERLSVESEEKKEPKLNPPSEGSYYTSKQDSMLTDDELQQMDEKGWVLVNVIPESYHDYLGCYPEAPMVLRTRYTYLFRRIKQAELK